MIWLGTVVLKPGPACAKSAGTSRVAMPISGNQRFNMFVNSSLHDTPHWSPGK